MVCGACCVVCGVRCAYATLTSMDATSPTPTTSFFSVSPPSLRWQAEKSAHIYTCVSMYTYVNVYIYPCTHTQTHANTHKNIHTHIHTHTHTLSLSLREHAKIRARTTRCSSVSPTPPPRLHASNASHNARSHSRPLSTDFAAVSRL